MNFYDAMSSKPIGPEEKQFVEIVMKTPTSLVPTGYLVQSLALLTSVEMASNLIYDDIPDRMQELIEELNARIPVQSK